MTTMLDKAALALFNQMRSHYDLEPIKTLEMVKNPDLFRHHVRAALQAIREPDAHMIEAGESAAWDKGNSMPTIRAMPIGFTAMIDAILEGKA